MSSKAQTKSVRLMTILAYVLAVSLAAIALAVYYTFFWDPATAIRTSVQPTPNVEVTTPNLLEVNHAED
ncbi:unnamed protein product [Dimorphilus gyrociliatus]|uniref:Uncharacterized protein n=1 Tax=Dimorphilus gyrociliatus TaxID=2664684 RepID=A0A7I8VV84_9ANNE|nr:unnamed protein product [Dimorphilus gyrociliatus]